MFTYIYYIAACVIYEFFFFLPSHNWIITREHVSPRSNQVWNNDEQCDNNCTCPLGNFACWALVSDVRIRSRFKTPRDNASVIIRGALCFGSHCSGARLTVFASSGVGALLAIRSCAYSWFGTWFTTAWFIWAYWTSFTTKSVYLIKHETRKTWHALM